MKLPAFLIFLLAGLLGAGPLHEARGDDASFDLFYGLLAASGEWYSTLEYGYVWQPSVTAKDNKWRPYTDGYWAQTDDGWTWVSYENFGWATYHYGRWTRLQDTGWVWVPGYDWGPGWVSWRTSDDYVGWAPLPPKCEQVAAAGGSGRPGADAPAPIASVNYYDVEAEEGFTPAVDARYDIGPDRYVFVRVGDFGNAPLRESVLPSAQNFSLFQATANVTDTTYRRGPERLEIIDHGPNPDFVNRRAARPIRRLRLQHHDDLAYLHDSLRDTANPAGVRDGVLHVASPTVVGRLVEFSKTRPQRIKQELAAPTVLHGWEHTGADEQTVQRERDRLRKTLPVAPSPRPPAGGPIPASP